MSKLVAVLLALNAIFAGSTLSLARELDEERSRVVVPSLVSSQRASKQSQMSATPDVADVETSVASVDPPKPTSLEPPKRPTPGQNARDRQRESERRRAQRFLALYGDPATRAQLLDERRLSAIRTLEGLLAEGLVTQAELDYLVGMIAEWQLERAETRARCWADPLCKPVNTDRRDVQGIRDRIAAYLGEARYARYQAFRDEEGEREGVDSFRSRLQGSSWMTDAQARTLVAALADERRKFEAEIEASGGAVQSYHSGFMVARAQRAIGEPYSADLESVVAFNQRMRERAAAHLTPEQLQAFSDMQDRSLVSIRASIEREDRRAARQAARKGAQSGSAPGR